MMISTGEHLKSHRLTSLSHAHLEVLDERIRNRYSLVPRDRLIATGVGGACRSSRYFKCFLPMTHVIGLVRINWRRVYGPPSSRKTITSTITVTAIRSWGSDRPAAVVSEDRRRKQEITKVLRNGRDIWQLAGIMVEGRRGCKTDRGRRSDTIDGAARMVRWRRSIVWAQT